MVYDYVTTSMSSDSCGDTQERFSSYTVSPTAVGLLLYKTIKPYQLYEMSFEHWYRVSFALQM